MAQKYQHKKQFGQHFLNNLAIQEAICEALYTENTCKKVLEVGPGEGALTQFLVNRSDFQLYISEIDKDVVELIGKKFPEVTEQILAGDFLTLDFNQYFKEEFAIIGNFPYNISTEIVFKIIDHKEQIPLAVGMFQKEVAERIASKHGSKVYGITSVLTQAYYDVEYLFEVGENEFIPPPKVKSAVIRMKRKENTSHIDFKKLKTVVKHTFNNRRKMMRKGLESLNIQLPSAMEHFGTLRPEQLSVQEFILLSELMP